MTSEIPPAPKPTSDDPLDKVAKDSNRILALIALIMSSLVVVLVVGGGIIFTSQYQQIKRTEQQVINTQQQQEQGKKSTCDFYSVIGTLPVLSSGANKAGQSLVRLIGDARITYSKRKCGVLPPPSISLIDLSVEYNIPISS
jgi:uncharacterized protein YpmB